MGNTIWIDVDERGKQAHADMSVLLTLEKPLVALAEMLGVTPLTAFYDYLPLLEAYDEGDDGDPVKPSWFDSTAGLRTIHALRDTIELDFTILDWSPDPSTKHWRRYLLDDLLACERVLKRAVTRKRKFRLMIVP